MKYQITTPHCRQVSDLLADIVMAAGKMKTKLHYVLHIWGGISVALFEASVVWNCSSLRFILSLGLCIMGFIIGC